MSPGPQTVITMCKWKLLLWSSMGFIGACRLVHNANHPSWFLFRIFVANHTVIIPFVTSKLVGLTIAERCPPKRYFLTLNAFWPFKVIQGHQPLHKSKAHIWFSISSIFHRFRDIVLQSTNQTPHLSMSPHADQGIPFKFPDWMCHAKSWKYFASFQ